MLVQEWDIPESDKALIDRIVLRTIREGIGFGKRDIQSLMMDLTYVHRNIFPLRLADLFAADAFNFFHDINGIVRHLDRREGVLRGFFVPRFVVSKRKGAA
ncbi:MAG: hypothetical protein IT181_12980 [Acidobacteria bacterium]|nr:hypothetical protein [Acidobacteriota bacterium]